MDITTSVTVVTGANRGLGRALVRRAARARRSARSTPWRATSAPCAATRGSCPSLRPPRRGQHLVGGRTRLGRDAADQQRLDRRLRRAAGGPTRRRAQGDGRQLPRHLRHDPRLRAGARGERRRPHRQRPLGARTREHAADDRATRPPRPPRTRSPRGSDRCSPSAASRSTACIPRASTPGCSRGSTFPKTPPAEVATRPARRPRGGPGGHLPRPERRALSQIWWSDPKGVERAFSGVAA